jgi:predicted nucleic acid-binding protein
MERSERIFVDSNFYVAFYNPLDSLHETALATGRKLIDTHTSVMISSLVFLETVTVLSQRVDRLTAVDVGRFLRESPQVQITHIDEAVHDESWRIFQEIVQKDVSLVDCSIMAAMRAEGVDTLLTFDRGHFRHFLKHYRFRFYGE